MRRLARSLAAWLFPAVLAGCWILAGVEDRPVMDASFDAGGPSAAAGCAEPNGRPCTDKDGLFVSPAGSDTQDGLRATPLRSINKALLQARINGKTRVFVCAGVYAESVKLDSASEGVSLHGGFDCATWTNAKEIVPLVKPSTPGYALEVRDRAAALVEGFQLEAPPGSAEVPSSIAVLVVGTSELLLRRDLLVANNGATGPAGQLRSNYSGAVAASGGRPDPGVCACVNGNACSGGKGGLRDYNTTGASGVPANVVDPAHPTANGAGHPQCGDCCGGNCNPANQGARGAGALTAGSATASLGSVTPTGYVGPLSLPGPDGRVGQGGGGGGEQTGPGTWAAGGGGGSGGCGGAGGASGGAGGASIALVAHDSTVRLVGSSLRASDGGMGGKGGPGQVGQQGGPGNTSAASDGGFGGSGGGGGGGPGGRGGLSAGVVFTPASRPPEFDGVPVTPVPTHSSVKLGVPGKEGAAGDGSSVVTTNGRPGLPGQAGVPGKAGEAHAVIAL